MKRKTPDHPKMKALARRLQIPLPYAVGVMEMLWHFCADYTPAGDVGRYSNEEIAEACSWPKEQGSDGLISALIECRWIDTNDEHRLIVHDWSEHADDSVNAKLARIPSLFADGTLPRLTRFASKEKETLGPKLEQLKRAHDMRTTCALNAHEMRTPCAPDSAQPLPFPSLPSPSMPEPQRDALVAPLRSAKVSSISSVKIPETHEGFEFADWAQSQIDRHPTGCNKQIVQQYFAERLFKPNGFEPRQFAEAHTEWCAYWKEPNSSFPVGLERFIFEDWWRKQPPRKSREPTALNKPAFVQERDRIQADILARTMKHGQPERKQ